MNNLEQIRQFLGEQPKDKMFSAQELWEIFNVFQPMLTDEQKDELNKGLEKMTKDWKNSKLDKVDKNKN